MVFPHQTFCPHKKYSFSFFVFQETFLIATIIFNLKVNGLLVAYNNFIQIYPAVLEIWVGTWSNTPRFSEIEPRTKIHADLFIKLYLKNLKPQCFDIEMLIES